MGLESLENLRPLWNGRETGVPLEIRDLWPHFSSEIYTLNTKLKVYELTKGLKSREGKRGFHCRRCLAVEEEP